MLRRKRTITSLSLDPETMPKLATRARSLTEITGVSFNPGMIIDLLADAPTDEIVRRFTERIASIEIPCLEVPDEPR